MILYFDFGENNKNFNKSRDVLSLCYNELISNLCEENTILEKT